MSPLVLEVPWRLRDDAPQLASDASLARKLAGEGGFDLRSFKMTVTQQDHLQDHKALVTGATSGLGRVIALRLARDGAEVVVVGRNATRGAETVNQITDAGGRAR